MANLDIQPEIKYVSIENLELWEENPRFNDDAVPDLMRSIQEYGFLQPLVVDEFNKVMVGNTRLKAARKLGLKQIPIVRADHLTKKQIEAYALVDNKTHELSSWKLADLPQLVSLADLPNLPGFNRADVDVKSPPSSCALMKRLKSH